MSDTEIILRTVRSAFEVEAEAWDRCADGAGGQRPENPFITHRFITAVEASGSAAPGTGWAPIHLTASDTDGEVIGVLPLYLKSHSQGEYVFDHGWADAFEQAGGLYYPKLQSSIPFTPVAGRRLLARRDHRIAVEYIEQALLSGARQLTMQCGASSLHITFCTAGEWQIGGELKFLQREGRQLHWENAKYGSFDDFLAVLSSRKRKQVRRERSAAAELGLVFETVAGDDIRPEHWDAMWEFYQDTGSRKWGMPYLTREFFDMMHSSMRDDVVLFMARHGARWVAGAWNFRGRDSLFGRYWGCLEFLPMVHFELCYYRAIDYAIEHGLTRVEAGAGGDFKSARGYQPAPTYSLHWISHPGLREAVDQFVGSERLAVRLESEYLTRHGAYRQATDESDGRRAP